MCQREDQLRRLMARDAAIFAERADTLNLLKSKEPAPKWDGLERWPDRPSETIYNMPYSVGRY